MKPWDEDWFPGDGVLHTDDVRIAVFEPIDRPHDPLSERQHARAKLASAAPALARALLAMEYDAHGGCCPSCRGTGYHKGWCALDAALRKAGVR